MAVTRTPVRRESPTCNWVQRFRVESGKICRVMLVETPPHFSEETLDCLGDAVLSTDLHGNVTYLNLAAEAMTGWPRELAAGRPLDQVLRIIDRDTRTAARDPLALAIE